MASQSLTENPQFTALGGFTLGYVEGGVYKEKFTPYVSERQRDILEARATHKPFNRHCDCYRSEGCAKCSSLR